MQRADAVQVAFGLLGLRAGLVELRACAVDACAVEARVDHEEGLALVDVGAFGEEHLLEVAFDAGADLHELLGADAADVFAVDVDVLGGGRFHGYDRQVGLHGLRPQDDDEHEGHDRYGAEDDDPKGARGAADRAADRGFQFFRTEVRDVRFELLEIHGRFLYLILLSIQTAGQDAVSVSMR